MQPSGSSTNFDQFYVAPSDITNSENGGLKFKNTAENLDQEQELERVFVDLQEQTRCPLTRRQLPQYGGGQDTDEQHYDLNCGSKHLFGEATK